MVNFMDVAIMYSGGKDSTLAIEYAIKNGYDIKYLLSVKPTRTDCYLFHYATVEHTRKLASILGLKHILISCDVADPVKEAKLVKDIVMKEDKVDALILGGVGLQETQIGSLQKALMPEGIEVYAAHSGEDHEILFREMLDRGYEIMITQVASDGLMRWLGTPITKENFEDLKKDSVKYGFHLGFEGGFADTLVLDGPIFSKKLDILDSDKVIESEYCGHILIKDCRVSNKAILKNATNAFRTCINNKNKLYKQ